MLDIRNDAHMEIWKEVGWRFLKKETHVPWTLCWVGIWRWLVMWLLSSTTCRTRLQSQHTDRQLGGKIKSPKSPDSSSVSLYAADSFPRVTFYMSIFAFPLFPGRSWGRQCDGVDLSRRQHCMDSQLFLITTLLTNFQPSLILLYLRGEKALFLIHTYSLVFPSPLFLTPCTELC